METLLAKKKVFRDNITRAEKAVSKVIHRQRIELMMAEIYKLLANICVEAKYGEENNTHEKVLGDGQERLTALMI
ncbi:hypothetical protein PR048_012918 [Dryococelus australis]|uniref:Uncharacterized protein n=1 Tax=Dryococelus australis TaxID=614101 RepID=A0ABQ9HQV4_9NEOP|nr:hypothetical protein PR048_012918 [Dryococelus australis]